MKQPDWNAKVEQWATSKLIPYARNTKQHPPEQVAKIAGSISLNGFVNPILIDKDGTIIAGHGRHAAALSLGLDHVPVIVCDHLAEEEVRALRIADNRLNESPWDADMLRFELKGLQEMGVELGTVDFGIPDITQFIENGRIVGGLFDAPRNTDPTDIPGMGGPGADGDAEDMPPDVVKFDFIKKGDLWRLGRHRLLCGSCTEPESWIRLMDVKADMTFTSPPYNLGISAKLSGNTQIGRSGNAYQEFNDAQTEDEWTDLVSNACALSLQHSRYVFWNVQTLAGNRRALWRWADKMSPFYCDLMVWDKQHAPPQQAARVVNSRFEFVWIFTSDEKPNRAIRIAPEFRGTIDNVYCAPLQRHNESSDTHGATFPVHLPTHFITNFTSSDAVVVDPFGGSGTTLIACEKTGRSNRSIELDPHYCAVILRRWAESTGEDPVREDGTTLSSLLEDWNRRNPGEAT